MNDHKNKTNRQRPLGNRDLRILRLLYEYRFLDSELIWYLLADDRQRCTVTRLRGSDGRLRPRTYGFSRQALYKRLRMLYAARYIERHYVTDMPWGRSYGSPRAIYGLGAASPQLLIASFGVPVRESRRILRNNRVRSPFLRHCLDTARFRVVLELASRRPGSPAVLDHWQQGVSLWDSVWGYNILGVRERFSIRPDAFFRLKYANGTHRHYFLEIDRGTEPIISVANRSNIRRKLLGYEYYRRSKRLAGRVSGQIGGFQVLILTTGRIESARSASGRIANILEEIRGHRDIYRTKSLFMLTVQSRLSLDRPESVLSDVWVSPSVSEKPISLA